MSIEAEIYDEKTDFKYYIITWIVAYILIFIIMTLPFVFSQ